MLISREFLFGLGAYVRQAELSLHRTPNNNLEALITYHAENRIPLPHAVLKLPEPARYLARTYAWVPAADTGSGRRPVCRRHSAGGVPTNRLKALANAASDS